MSELRTEGVDRLSAHDEGWKVGLEGDRGAPWGLRDVEGRLEA